MSTENKKASTTVVKKQSEITDEVMRKIQVFQSSGELKLPSDYSPENALKGAQLVLADMTTKNNVPILEHCTKSSIANSLFKMVTMGLSVVKKQGNFIPYGKELSFQEEYTGNIVLAKRYGGLLGNPKAHVIYEGDDFEFEVDTETGKTRITKHKTSLDNLGKRNKIKGAYCIYKTKDGVDVEIMNFEQIENSWKQGSMKGNSGAHNNFTDQMCKKTVINRAMKLLVRGSDDAVLFDYDEKTDKMKESVDNEINENANGEIIDIEHETVDDTKKIEQGPVEVKQTKKEPKPEKTENVKPGQTGPLF